MTQKVPTNIITGFLGVGKTTTILNLLKNKPESESWAVLVNEFGEIGIDGAIMSDQDAMIKEVPGGCMCCTAGVPMSVGINALLRQKPDRLIIEPTGLGHPKQVIAKLTSSQFAPYVDLKATIALVDPRNFSDERYTSNQNFNDQLDSADIIMANKADLCSEGDLTRFDLWVEQQEPKKLAAIRTTQGEIELNLLDIPRTEVRETDKQKSHHHHHEKPEPLLELPPGETFIRRENKGQDYVSCGWLFSTELIFDFDKLFGMLMLLPCERIKAVVNTEKGCCAYNVSNGVVSVNELNMEDIETRFEIINGTALDWESIEEQLLAISN